MKRSLGIKNKVQNLTAEVDHSIDGEPQSIEYAYTHNNRQRGFLCGNDVLKSIESNESDQASIETLEIDSFAGTDNGNGV